MRPDINVKDMCLPATSANTRGIHPAGVILARQDGPTQRNIPFSRFRSDQPPINVPMRSGVECRAGGTGAKSETRHQCKRQVFTGDFGKHARHPPRERDSYTTAAGGHGGPPLRRGIIQFSRFQSDQPPINVSTHSGVECRAGGTGAESETSRQS